MKKYKGPTKNIRKDYGKSHKWFTLKDGDVIPKELEDQFPDVIDSEGLSKMTKDELNDYAVHLGLTKEIKHSMKRAEMLEVIIDHLQQ